MRIRFLSLLMTLLAAPLPALATQPLCEDPPLNSSLPDRARAETLAKRAFACLEERKEIQSIALFSEIIGIDPDNAQAYLNRGSTFVRLRLFHAAIRDLSRVVELEPNRFEGWYDRGVAHLAARQYGEAISDLNTAIRLNPGLGHAYCNRGLALQRTGAKEKALADFEAGLERATDLSLCYYGRAEIELADRKYQDAIKDLTRSINIKPAADAFVHRAIAFERLGAQSDALKDYRSALSLQPRSSEARSGLARLLQHKPE